MKVSRTKIILRPPQQSLTEQSNNADTSKPETDQTLATVKTAPRLGKYYIDVETNSSSALPTTWIADYKSRLDAGNANAQRINRGNDYLGVSHQLTASKVLYENDVFLPIAASWYGLVKRDVHFAFGGKRLFEWAQFDDSHGMTCVLSPNAFIIPLVFNADMTDLPGKTSGQGKRPAKSTSKGRGKQSQENSKKAKTTTKTNLPGEGSPRPSKVAQPRKCNHGIIAIAKYADEPQSNQSLSLTFMDSQSNPKNYDRFSKAAKNIFRYSKWVKHWPACTDENWAIVPQQGRSNSTPVASGVHVVLNAWAYMLDIPLAPSARLDKNFYTEARKLMRLALKGCLDSETIRAFLQAYKYVIPQDLAEIRHREEESSALVDSFRHMQSEYMNDEIFNEIIDQIHRDESPSGANEADNTSSGDRGNSRDSDGDLSDRIPPLRVTSGLGSDPSLQDIKFGRPGSSQPLSSADLPQPEVRLADIGGGQLGPESDPLTTNVPQSEAKIPSSKSWDNILIDGLQRYWDRYHDRICGMIGLMPKSIRTPPMVGMMILFSLPSLHCGRVCV